MDLYTPPKGLIISPSGMRGIVGKTLDPEVILKFCESFGMWLKQNVDHQPKVLVGMDPRTSGPMVKNTAIGALLSVGIKVIDVDVCPTPALMFGHKVMECDGTVIISASHNPPTDNGMKCLAPSGTFLSYEELEAINQYFHGHSPVEYVDWTQHSPVIVKKNLVEEYLEELKDQLNLELFDNQGDKPLKVVMDPGAGAGVGVTGKVLSDLGCQVTEINTVRNEDGTYPRMFEPTIDHLGDLGDTIKSNHADVGFAHDFDADRVTLIGEKGQVYREDVILALIWNHLFKRATFRKIKKILTVTNCASSLMFDDLAEKYNAKIFHTPIGERYLAEKMNHLIEENDETDAFIFGGEGSCGGYMLPLFNNTRDGIFAAVTICEILLETRKSISELVAELPEYVSLRRKVPLGDHTVREIMDKLIAYLDGEGLKYERIDRDVKIFGEREWTLVHPSNTEPIFRIITEAPTESRAEELLDKMDKKVQEML